MPRVNKSAGNTLVSLIKLFVVLAKHNASGVNNEEAPMMGAYLKTLGSCSCRCESHERLYCGGFGAFWHECRNMNTQAL